MAKRLVKFDFDPLKIAKVDKRVPKETKDRIYEEVADLVLEEVLDRTAKGQSPVKGGEWQRKLSKDYRAKKVSQGGTSFSDLRLDFDLMQSLTVKPVGGKLRLTVGEDQQGKADGHNNFTGKSNLPPREFIPNVDKGQGFDEKIQNKITRIVNDILSEDGEDNV